MDFEEDFDLDEDDLQQLDSIEQELLRNAQESSRSSVANVAHNNGLEKKLQSKNGEVAILHTQLKDTQSAHRATIDALKTSYEKDLRYRDHQLESLRKEIERIQTEAEFQKQEQVEPTRNTRKRTSGNTDGFNGGNLKRLDGHKVTAPLREIPSEILQNILHFDFQGVNTIETLSSIKTSQSSAGSIFLRSISKPYDNAEKLIIAASASLLDLWRSCFDSEQERLFMHIAALLGFLLSYSFEACQHLQEAVLKYAGSSLENILTARIKNDIAHDGEFESLLWSLMSSVCMFVGPSVWHHIRLELLLAALSPKQPPATTFRVLGFLQYSATSSTFGSVATEQGRYEAILLDSVSKILTESRSTSVPVQTELRLSVCDLCFTILSKRPNFRNKNLAARLIRCNASAIDSILRCGLQEESNLKLIECITLLLAAMPQLDFTSSSYQKHLLCCSRIAFANASLQVSDNVTETAREMLEGLVTMEEAEAVWECFATPTTPE